MASGEVGLFVLLIACLSIPISSAIVAGIVWLGIAIYRRNKRRALDRWSGLASTLGLRIEEPLPNGRMRGRAGALEVVLEERLARPVTAAEVAVDVAALVLAPEMDGSEAKPVTLLRARLPRPLPQRITVAHVRSGLPARPHASERPVPGHANVIADSVHRITCEDAAWAASFLKELAARGGLADLEASGWRVSFDREEARLERDGAASAALAQAGLALLPRLVARLTPPEALR